MAPRTPPSPAIAAGAEVPKSQQQQPTAGPAAHSKPCNACRRRKVRCCKTQPGCSNCAKHGLVCVYDSVDGAAAAALAYGTDQSALYDRIHRLERLIEDMSSAYQNSHCNRHPPYTYGHIRPPNGLSSHRRTSDHGSPDWSNDGYADDDSLLRSEREDTGTQVFEPHVGYYMNSTYWMNLHDFINEPRCLLRVPAQAEMPPAVWPFSVTASAAAQGLVQQDMSHMHLPLDKENFLLDYFWKKIHPFFNVNHRQSFRDTLEDFRRGTCPIHREFEASMLSQQLLAVCAMDPGHLQQTLGQTREELISHLRMATETAMKRANVLRTRKFIGFQALVYYIVFLFAVGQAESAISIIGLAGRVGMRMGLHRDPAHYHISPWVAEMRRRLWNLLIVLDSQMFNGEGTESGLEPLSNVQRSINADDCEWFVSRFAKPDSTPLDHEGWTELTHTILWGEVVKLSRRLGRMSLAMAPAEEMYRLLNETEAHLMSRFVGRIDESDPMQVITVSRFKAEMAHQRLAVGLHTLKATKSSNVADQDALFRQAIEALEETSRGEAVAMAQGLSWLYKWPVPWNAIASVLTGLAQMPQHPEVDRAWNQIELAFRRHGTPDAAAWRAIEQLCDQAMFYHPDRMHVGAAYATRVPGTPTLPIASGNTASLVAGSSSKCAGDVVGREGISRQASTSPAPPQNAAIQPSPVSAAGGPPTSRLFGDVQMLSADFGGAAGAAAFGSFGQGYIDVEQHGGGMVGMDDHVSQMLYSDWGGDPRRISAGY